MIPFHDETQALFLISVAAELSGLHPQTLRQYDRLGLVSPSRSVGRGRRYSIRDIALLRNVSRLTDEGINLAGIKRIIELESTLSQLSSEIARLNLEVSSLLQQNPRHAITTRRRSELLVYKKTQSL
jgi:MerR family transcriptional regulator/heat shock protein HspR